MGEHTKGPWHISRISKKGYAFISGEGWSEFCRVVVQMSGDKTDTPEGVANANLIAAAHELLGALEAAVECGMVPNSTALEGGAARHARQVVVADMIRAAIAKAKGESQ